jgi:hypothetical protein
MSTDSGWLAVINEGTVTGPLASRLGFIALALALAAVVSTASAQTQRVTPHGIQCGGYEVSFNELSASSEGANSGRRAQLREIFSYATAALDACDHVDSLPGCLSVTHWVNERKVDYPGDLDARTRLLALDHVLLMNSRRVLAHAHCLAQVTQAFEDGFSETCSQLIEAERNSDDDAVENISRTLVDVAPEGRIKMRLLAADVMRGPSDQSAADRLLKQLELNVTRCSAADKKCSPEKAEASVEVIRMTRARAFYDGRRKLGEPKKRESSDDGTSPSGDPIGTVESMPSRVAFAVEQVPYNRPDMRLPDWTKSKDDDQVKDSQPTGAPPQRSPGESGASASADGEERGRGRVRTRDVSWVMPELAAIEDREKACQSATFYVSARGVVHYNPRSSERADVQSDASDRAQCPARKAGPPDERATICVDSSNYALDRPFVVDLTQYNDQGFGAHEPSELSTDTPRLTRSVKAWPGEKTPIDDVLCQSLIRIQVSGFPRGQSLRAIAMQGTKAQLEKNVFSLDLVAEARELELDRTQLAATNGDVLGLVGFADLLAKDAAYEAGLKKMQTAATAKDAKGLKQAQQEAGGAIGALLGRYIEDPRGIMLSSTTRAWIDAQGKLSTADDSKLEPLLPDEVKLRELASTIAQRIASLNTTMQTARTRDLGFRKKLYRLCSLANYLVPFVDEDVLLDAGREGVYVLDYDFSSGFRGSTVYRLDEEDRIFLRVRHVKPAYGIALSVNDRGIVQHTVSLVGYASANGTPSGAQSNEVAAEMQQWRESLYDLDPDTPVAQPDSTQILSLGSLTGGRKYNLALCADKGGGANCQDEASADKTVADGSAKKRVIARNTIVVQAKHHLGVRAGLGANISLGKVRVVEAEPALDAQLVRGRNHSTDFALPLLLCVYIGGRYGSEGPPPRSNGPLAGLDLMTLGTTPRLYGGWVLDLYGIGLTGGVSLDKLSTVNAREGTALASTEKAPSEDGWYPGVFLALTTDLDIFQAVYGAYFSPAKYPTVGAGAPR